MPAAISPMVASRATLFMRSSARCASLSARRWSVMSSPESMTPVATLSTSRSATPRQVMKRSSPSEERTWYSQTLRLVVAAHEQARNALRAMARSSGATQLSSQLLSTIVRVLAA